MNWTELAQNRIEWGGGAFVNLQVLLTQSQLLYLELDHQNQASSSLTLALVTRTWEILGQKFSYFYKP